MTQKPEIKTLVLKKSINDDEASQIIRDKKTSLFKSLLKKPKKDEVHVDSLKLFYECLLMVSGRYIADYYRKATHSISVDSNVKEVTFGGGVFPIKEKSGLKKAFVGIGGKNKIEFPLEEHVFVDEEQELVFDYNGNEIEFPFKINSRTIENYPEQTLNENPTNVRNAKISHQSAIKSLNDELKSPLEKNIKKLTEEFIIEKINEIYVPIYEARLTGPKNKTGLLRLDAVRKKIL